MRMKKYGMILLGLAAFTLCGGTAVSASAAITVESRGTPDVRILGAVVEPDGDGLVVSGQVKRVRSYRKKRIPRGHMDITVMAPDGSVLASDTAEYSPVVIPRRGLRRSSFSIRLPVGVPDAARVKIAFHGGYHP